MMIIFKGFNYPGPREAPTFLVLRFLCGFFLPEPAVKDTHLSGAVSDRCILEVSGMYTITCGVMRTFFGLLGTSMR